MKRFLALILIFSSSAAMACPFCDQGGQDTALFIGVIFGLFAFSMFCLYLFALKMGAFNDNTKIADAVAEAESRKNRI
jgi:hypothetical protein